MVNPKHIIVEYMTIVSLLIESNNVQYPFRKQTGA